MTAKRTPVKVRRAAADRSADTPHVRGKVAKAMAQHKPTVHAAFAGIEDAREETTITYRVPKALKDDFMRTLKKRDRNISLVLRDFMRDVVKSDGRTIDAPSIEAPAISDAERRRRAQAIAYGQASVALEGFPVTEDAKQLADRFVAGEIGLNEYASAPYGGTRER